MKISDERVSHTKLKARQDEKLRLTFTRNKLPMRGSRFECA